MKAVVTGVAGFIGSHIAKRLLKDGHDVFGIDDLSSGYTENIPKGVKWIPEDICKPERYSHFFDNADVVFHNAASKKNICLKNPCRDMEVNGIGTLKLLTECLAKGVRKFIHASTGSVYGEVIGTIHETTHTKPCSYYGVSKLAGEGYVNLFHHLYVMDTTILRYFHVYGSRQEKNQETGGVVAIFSDKIKKGEDITIHGDGTQRRVFTCVEDIVEANIKAWEILASKGRTYNCASSEQTDINSLAEMIMTHFDKKVNIKYADALIGDIYNFHVDSSRIKEEIGVSFRPITDVL